jgi:hypothetical protein
MGKEFLIKDSLTSLAWKMEAEKWRVYLLQSHSCKKTLAQLILET